MIDCGEIGELSAAISPGCCEKLLTSDLQVNELKSPNYIGNPHIKGVKQHVHGLYSSWFSNK